jgi:hypothetical protein
MYHAHARALHKDISWVPSAGADGQVRDCPFSEAQLRELLTRLRRDLRLPQPLLTAADSTGIAPVFRRNQPRPPPAIAPAPNSAPPPDQAPSTAPAATSDPPPCEVPAAPLAPPANSRPTAADRVRRPGAPPAPGDATPAAHQRSTVSRAEQAMRFADELTAALRTVQGLADHQLGMAFDDLWCRLTTRGAAVPFPPPETSEKEKIIIIIINKQMK